MNLIGLDRSPVVWYDEVGMGMLAKEFVSHGKFISPVDAAINPLFEKVYLAHAPGHPLVTAAVYKIFGFGIWQTRTHPLIFGACDIVILYFLVLLLFNNQRAALLSALLFALDPRVIQAFRHSRADAQYLFFALLGIWIYLRNDARKDKLRYLYLSLSGLALGLAFMTHPVALPLALTLGAWILILDKGSRLRSIFFFSIFAILPLAIFWFVYVGNSTSIFLLQFMPTVKLHSESGSILHRIISLSLRLWLFYREIPFLLLTHAVSFLWVMFNPAYQKRIKIIIGVLFVLPLLFSLYGASSHFCLYLLPALTICSGVFIAAVLPIRGSRPLKIHPLIIKIFIIALLANLLMRGIIGRYIVLACQWKERDYRSIELPILETIPKGSIVWGSPQTWYALEKAGAYLLLRGTPDPDKHDYVITWYCYDPKLLTGFRKIKEIGQFLPLIFGKFAVPSTYSYRLWIWQSEKRCK
jgi:4-amino-4-deoxy-L-arabinose transferase-like glycosyltransferase